MRELLLCPPDYYGIEYEINPWMSRARGAETELAALKSMSPDELEEFALDNGWGVVSRLGGRQIEFYNDAGARLANEV